MNGPSILRSLWLLAALVVGPLLLAPATPAGPAAGATDRDGEGGAVRVELAAKAAVVGAHGAAALLALPAPAAPVSGGAPLADEDPAVPPGVVTRPFDRVSYRTTGPPIRVS